MASSRSPRDLVEAFEQTSIALQQFGLERVRVVGLSAGCVSLDVAAGRGHDTIRTLTEQQFMREFVFHLRPCIIVDAIHSWAAMSKWRSDRYLFDLDKRLPLVESEDDGEEGAEWTESETGSEENVFTKPIAGLHEKRVTVALTPNGRADAVTHVVYDPQDVPPDRWDNLFGGDAERQAVSLSTHPAIQGSETNSSGLRAEKMFLAAAEVKVTLPEFYHLLQRNAFVSDYPPTHIDMREYKRVTSEPSVIAYGQLQNNCFNTEYTHLHADVVPNIEEFGTRIFGKPPEASNVWFGTGLSVSSMHQDWVENLYAVVRGVKEFVLIPPWEGPFVPKPEIPSAFFELDVGRSNREKLDFRFSAYPKKDGSVMPWMDLDFTPEFVESSETSVLVNALNTVVDECHAQSTAGMTDEQRSKVPPRHATTLHPLVAHVHPGETLYLPAMWLHRVSQRPDEVDIAARARCRKRSLNISVEENEENTEEEMPLPLIAAVNYWYEMSFDNPAVVMLREFGVLL